MFEIIMSVCLSADPHICKNVHLTYMGEISTPYQCMHKSQPEMAKWSVINPGWKIMKFKCGNVRSAEKSA